jgi:heme exporter protein C
MASLFDNRIYAFSAVPHFFWVSTEATMGIIQRIFYFHVPAAVVSFVAVFTGGIASLLYLKTQNLRYDVLAVAAHESVLVFQAINIVLGSIWARRTWGIWWTWDARLTSSLLLVFIYAGYVMVRKATSADQRATTSAVICVFGMTNVPFIYMSNRIFRTQHPSPVMGGGEGSGLAPDMLVTFVVASISMLMLWWCLLRIRRRLEKIDSTLNSITRTVFG